MSQKNAVLIRGSFEKCFVAGSRQPDILHSHNVDVGLRSKQSAKYVVIEILVGQPAQHGYRRRRSSNRERIPSGRHRASFELRISSAASVRFARYAFSTSGLRRLYPIA